ncbi:P-loop NTPase fold protein [Ferrimonas sp. YFM]|uniref:KAP family P-loop NTPase fold protein n=1 Tax=Ferrimonas sp. YFM TaxID=3028878 RepID=UPI002573BF38|nr:P-loop NTPase fold protein [Ferrimonas sp. YFM]BDY03811.1 NTPase [Ferrimonas sp. YFM]
MMTILDANSANPTWNDDLLGGREAYALSLTKHLLSQPNGYALNINAPWGAGKTFFLKCWQNSLSVPDWIQGSQPILAIYIDAWETDFADDPLLACVAQISTQLKPHIEGFDQKSRSWLEATGSFMKKAAPEMVRAAVRKAIGFDWEAAIHSNEDEEALSQKLSEAPPKRDLDNNREESDTKLIEHMAMLATKGLIDRFEKDKAHIQSFRTSLSQLMQMIMEEEKSPYCGSQKVFIFIDELDRCRPSYAIELLELIKHMFYIPEAAFVVATDSSQLRHAISGVYGESFDGGRYLGRFFNSRFMLPKPSTTAFLNSRVDWSKNPHFGRGRIWPRDEKLVSFASVIGGYTGLELRDIHQVALRLEFIMEQNPGLIHGPTLIFLLCLSVSHADLYESLKIGRLSLSTDQDSSVFSKIEGFLPYISHGPKAQRLDNHIERYGPNGLMSTTSIDHLVAEATIERNEQIGDNNESQANPFLSPFIVEMSNLDEASIKRVVIRDYFKLVDVGNALEGV